MGVGVEGDFGWWAGPGEAVEAGGGDGEAAAVEGACGSCEAGDPVVGAVKVFSGGGDVYGGFGGGVDGDVEVGDPGGEQCDLFALLGGGAGALCGGFGEVECELGFLGHEALLSSCSASARLGMGVPLPWVVGRGWGLVAG